MVAAGNDFVVIDHRQKLIANLKRFAQKICRPHFGVGADGVLLVEPSRKADFFMRIVNADGSEAEACGNGYRCVAVFAHQVLGFPKRVSFQTRSGMVEAELVARAGQGQSRLFQRGPYRVRAEMPSPTGTHEHVEIGLNGNRLSAAFIQVGVPHVVIFTAHLDRMPVVELGRAIRTHEQFAPRGTNVNFVKVTGAHQLAIRTYERGVEGETLACGTGSVAAALVAARTGRVVPPVHVKTKSGEVLIVTFKSSRGKIQNVSTEGSAAFVFQGDVRI